MVDEAHVTTFAVLPAYRRRGLGGRLLWTLMELAVELGATVVTLEVRLSNAAARRLYQRFGFRPVGVRPRYYSDNGEDALIMTTEPLDLPDMQDLRRRLAERYAADVLAEDPGWVPDDGDDGGRDVNRSRGLPPGRGVLLRRDRRGGRRARPAHRRQTSWPARWRSTRRPAASCPRWLRAPTCAG